METKQIKQIDSDEVEIDLKELFLVLWHKVWLIILAGVICVGIAGVWTKTMITPLYQSSSMLYILSQSTSITSLADIQLGTQLTKDYAVLIKSRPVVNEVIKNLDLNITYGEFLDMLSIETPADTRVISMTILHRDPEMAKKIADELANVSAKRMAVIMKTEEPSVVEEGTIAESPSTPNIMRNCAVAGLVGIMAVSVVFLLLYFLDDNIKTTDDVERYLGLTILGMIPMEEDEKNGKKKHRFNRTGGKRREK